MRTLLPLLAAPLLIAASKYSDSYCSKTVCIHAELNKKLSLVNYKVSAANEASAREIGWMAVGFGTKMANADMVVLWANNASSMTLSHRTAPGHEMPQVVKHPSRIATPLPHLSTASQEQLEFAFSVPFNEDAAVDHVFAASPARPTSSAVDSPITFHSLDFGRFTLNYTGTQKSDPLKHQRALGIAHGVFMWLGFLVALPIGALIARFARTSTPVWFKAHWIAQGGVAAPLILVAAILAIVAISIQPGGGHFDDAHKQTGLVILILYFIQVYGGYYIHTYKSEAYMIKGRPLVNYLHPIFGLFIIALAFIQVHSGYAYELALVGVNKIPKGVDALFYVWLVLLTVLYVLGLSLLPKQYAQEERQRRGGIVDERAPLIRPAPEEDA